jgi:hypothetical protein
LHIEEDHLKKIAMNMKKKQENSKHQMTTNNNIPKKKLELTIKHETPKPQNPNS